MARGCYNYTLDTAEEVAEHELPLLVSRRESDIANILMIASMKTPGGGILRVFNLTFNFAVAGAFLWTIGVVQQLNSTKPKEFGSPAKWMDVVTMLTSHKVRLLIGQLSQPCLKTHPLVECLMTKVNIQLLYVKHDRTHQFCVLGPCGPVAGDNRMES